MGKKATYRSASKPGRQTDKDGNRKPISKKKQIREMRQSSYKNERGQSVSHKMAWTGDPSKKRGKFGVFPTVAPKKGKEKSSKPSDWKKQTAQEAAKKGEMVTVKRRKKAQKLAAGSWKKGKDKREAMKAYRKSKTKK